MKTLFIINPRAGRGKAKEIWEELKDPVAKSFPDAQVIFTKAADHAQVIASQHADHRIIVVGGDGTFHEALQGSMVGAKEMGIIPAGSGNDLVKALGRSNDPSEALRRLIEGHRRTIDIGRIGAEFFVNGAGIGYDAKVTHDVNHQKGWLTGRGRYFYAVLKNLLFYQGPKVRIESQAFSYEGKILCLTVGGGPYLGGGIPIVPHASIDDGLLSFTLIKEVGIWGRLRYLKKVLTGKHEQEDFVEMFDETSCLIESTEELIYHQDGEVFYGKRLAVDILANSLTIVG